MVELREPRLARLIRWILVGIVVLLVIGFGLSKRRATDTTAAVLCGNLYRAARTPAESSAVDHTRPIVGRGDAMAMMDCGGLRRRGEVR
jgi:hypothetical protein